MASKYAVSRRRGVNTIISDPSPGPGTGLYVKFSSMAGFLSLAVLPYSFSPYFGGSMALYFTHGL